MTALAADYGKYTWSGQYYDTNDLAHIRDACHLKPALVGGDFMDYSPSRVAHGNAPPGYTESLDRPRPRGLCGHHVLALERADQPSRYRGSSLVAGVLL